MDMTLYVIILYYLFLISLISFFILIQLVYAIYIRHDLKGISIIIKLYPMSFQQMQMGA